MFLGRPASSRWILSVTAALGVGVIVAFFAVVDSTAKRANYALTETGACLKARGFDVSVIARRDGYPTIAVAKRGVFELAMSFTPSQRDAKRLATAQGESIGPRTRRNVVLWVEMLVPRTEPIAECLRSRASVDSRASVTPTGQIKPIDALRMAGSEESWVHLYFCSASALGCKKSATPRQERLVDTKVHRERCVRNVIYIASGVARRWMRERWPYLFGKGLPVIRLPAALVIVPKRASCSADLVTAIRAARWPGVAQITLSHHLPGVPDR